MPDVLTDQEYAEHLQLLDAVSGDAAELRALVSRDAFLSFVKTHAMRDLYFFNRAVLGYADMVPHLHGQMCEFATDPINRRKGYLIPRGHFKSSCITIGKTLQTAMLRPNMRMCIYHEKAEQAEGFLSQIKNNIERNVLLRALFPERMPPSPVPKGWVWRTDKIVLPRAEHYPEATVTAKGAGGASQGLHFTDMVWDDLIGEEAAGNPEVMLKVIDWMKKGEALSVTPTELWLDIIGTRWAMDDIYSWAQADGYAGMPWFHRSAVIGESAKSPLFPERFTMETLDALAKQDFYIFSCQYLNEPASSEQGEFKPEHLRYYHKETTERPGQRPQAIAKIEEPRATDGTPYAILNQMTVTIHCDPGPGLVQGRAKRQNRISKSAIVVCGLAPPRKIFLLHIWARHCTADDYITKILDYVDAYDGLLRCVSVEAHGWTHMIRTGLLKEASRRGVNLTEARCKPYTKSANTAKEGRVRKLQSWFSQGHIFLEHGEYDFERMYRGFPLINAYDELDALAQGPEYWEPFPEEEFLGLSGDPIFPDISAKDLGANAITGY